MVEAMVPKLSLSRIRRFLDSVNGIVGCSKVWRRSTSSSTTWTLRRPLTVHCDPSHRLFLETGLGFQEFNSNARVLDDQTRKFSSQQVRASNPMAA